MRFGNALRLRHSVRVDTGDNRDAFDTRTLRGVRAIMSREMAPTTTGGIHPSDHSNATRGNIEMTLSANGVPVSL